MGIRSVILSSINTTEFSASELAKNREAWGFYPDMASGWEATAYFKGARWGQHPVGFHNRWVHMKLQISNRCVPVHQNICSTISTPRLAHFAIYAGDHRAAMSPLVAHR